MMRKGQKVKRSKGHPHHTVHVGFSPDDVMVVVDNHWSAEDVEVLHHILLHVSQGGDVCVVTCTHTPHTPRTHTHTHTHTHHSAPEMEFHLESIKVKEEL